MTTIRLSLLIVPLFAVTITEGAELYHGPPASPLSWSDMEPKPGEVFSSPQDILGAPRLPVSVKLVEFTDQRPYGEARRQVVWLARYDSLVVHCGGLTASIALSLAFESATGRLLCAFTDPSPKWARSTDPTGDIESTMGWKMYPAQYESLHSKVTDVIAVMWKIYNADPGKVGQVVIRPRFNKNEFRTLVLHTPPSNVWLVEVLGKYAAERRGDVWTTLVIAWRDGDLEQLFGTVAP